MMNTAKRTQLLLFALFFFCATLFSTVLEGKTLTHDLAQRGILAREGVCCCDTPPKEDVHETSCCAEKDGTPDSHSKKRMPEKECLCVTPSAPLAALQTHTHETVIESVPYVAVLHLARITIHREPPFRPPISL